MFGCDFHSQISNHLHECLICVFLSTFRCDQTDFLFVLFSFLSRDKVAMTLHNMPSHPELCQSLTDAAVAPSGIGAADAFWACLHVVGYLFVVCLKMDHMPHGDVPVSSIGQNFSLPGFVSISLPFILTFSLLSRSGDQRHVVFGDDRRHRFG